MRYVGYALVARRLQLASFTEPAADGYCTHCRPTSQAFSNTFSIGESTNKRTVMFKDNGLSCST